MPVEGLAPRYRELGRLKFGEDLGDRPAQLKTWRLTSDNPDLIEYAAGLWGGPVQHREGGSEVIVETDALDVLIPPQDLAAGQWYELWAAGGLQRRCSGTGLVEYDPAEPTGWRKVAPCICGEENTEKRSCKITTVLRVLLPQLPDLGVWRLVTRSLYAATELPPAADFLLQASGGQPAPAVLALDSRSTKRPGEGRREYVVPVLRTRSTLAELLAGDGERQDLPLSAAAGALEAPSGNSLEGPEPDQAPPPGASSEDPGAPGPEAHSGGPEASSAVSAPADPWAELAAFLYVAMDTLPTSSAGIIDVLAELGRLMAACALWKGDALDAAAARWLEGLDSVAWREPGAVETHAIRSFAKRALIAAAGDFNNDDRGYSAAQTYERTPRP